MSSHISTSITEAVVNEIERLEPGVHQYFPVDVTLKNGSKGPRRWLLNICTALDSISLEHSPEIVVVKPLEDAKYHRSWQHRAKFNVMAAATSGEIFITCDRKQVGSHHLWNEYKFEQSIFISDELSDAFERIGGLYAMRRDLRIGLI